MELLKNCLTVWNPVICRHLLTLTPSSNICSYLLHCTSINLYSSTYTLHHYLQSSAFAYYKHLQSFLQTVLQTSAFICLHLQSSAYTALLSIYHAQCVDINRIQIHHIRRRDPNFKVDSEHPASHHKPYTRWIQKVFHPQTHSCSENVLLSIIQKVGNNCNICIRDFTT